MPGPATDAPERVSDSHIGASPPGSPPHEADTVSLEEQLEGTRIKGCSQFTPPPSKMVVVGRQCASISTNTHIKICCVNLNRCIKKG